MPRFEFRCEAQDGSGHFRSGTIEEETKAKARVTLELRELQRAAWTMPDGRAQELLDTYGAASLDELPKAAPRDASEEEKQAFRELKVRDRAHLVLHRQQEPYKLVSLKEVK